MNNLNNLSDDELDKLFRQSAEESDVEFDEGAWQKMNSLLDEKQPLRTNWRKYSLIILAILFLGSTAVYFGNENGLFNSFQKEENKLAQNDKKVEKGAENSETYQNSVAENSEEIFEKKEIKIADNESVENFENNNLKNYSSENSSKKLETPIAKNNKIIKPENSTNSKNIGSENKLANNSEAINNSKKSNLKIAKNSESGISTKNRTKDSISEPVENQLENGGLEKESSSEKNAISFGKTKSETKENSKYINSKSKNDKPQKIINNSILSNNNLSKNNSVKNKIESRLNNTSENQQVTNLNEVAEATIEKTYLQNISLDYLLSKSSYTYKKPKFEVEVNPLEIDLPEPKKVEFYKKGLAIRLAISPDISTVSSNKISKIGSNIGGLLEYRFSNKLSLQAGVFRSMKYYDAMPDQYTWVWGYSHDKLVDINAQCKMVDFPVNIRYDFLAKGPTRIFVGAGFTTYKMMNEKYHYNYENNYSSTIKHRDWEGKTGTYYSSNLNLSVGLEKYISKNFTIQVEPFAKSPLKSIGFGKVPLITYGMLISGKYPLNNLLKKQQ